MEKPLKIRKIQQKPNEEARQFKNSYTRLQDGKDALIRSEKLAFTGRIAAGIAHEIRNPLANVSLSFTQLKKTLKPKPSEKEYIEIIIRNIERINYLITELLNCARPPKLNMRPHDIHEILNNILETTKTKRKLQKIKVIKKFSSSPFIIKMDKEQIERALQNIIINAIESMPKSGSLSITTELDGPFLIIKVQDTGKGIPEKDMIRIFDPFFSTKREGVGLGLTLCYNIIVSHDGTIEVESKKGRGTIFTILFDCGRNL